MMLCPCCSGFDYEKCCGPLHRGAPAENALALMRSRYSAYALNLPDYIIRTAVHPVPKNEIEHFCKYTEFKKLEIIKFEDGKNEASVSFIAYLNDDKLVENSRFVKDGLEWLYVDGTFS